MVPKTARDQDKVTKSSCLEFHGKAKKSTFKDQDVNEK